MSTTMAQALSIAGSDSGGGAGIQADLKTMQALGVFGASVITAITAQNTKGVIAVHELPPPIVRAQLDAVFDDFAISAVKTGMLSSAVIVETVSAALRERNVDRLVVDPVMISKSGHALLRDDARRALERTLLPLALVVTPNVHEAELLSGMTITSDDDVRVAAQRIMNHGCRAVIVKGGHSIFSPGVDVLFDGERFHEYRGDFVDTPNTHGTGCTFSAAITARLALGEPLTEAVRNAKIYISRAISQAPDIGSGHGPTNHFYFLGPNDALTWSDSGE